MREYDAKVLYLRKKYMRYISIVFILILNTGGFAQISDSFNYQDESLSAIWQGNRDVFKLNSMGQLQLNSTAVGVSELFAPYNLIDSMMYNFWIKISFNTSSNNYVRFYMMADSATLEHSSNALYWSFGESNDSIKLYLKKDNNLKSIYTCKFLSTSKTVNEFRFSMLIDSAKQLKIKIKQNEEQVYCIDDSVHIGLPTYTSVNAGMYCKYTISNATKIFFDDIYIGKQYIEAPQLLGEKAKPGDLIINEVLFNPTGEGVDFVELYNNTSRILNLKDVCLSNKYATGILKDVAKITDKTYNIMPYTYVVVTADSTILMQQYQLTSTINYIEMADFPAFNNDEGFVVITDDSARIIDEMYYSETMHFDLLTDVEGVSLERINFSMPSNSSSTWHSSASVTYATPGYENSQYIVSNQTIEEIQFSSTVFSPNNNGHDDVLAIQYKFSQTDVICNVLVYNDKGILVRNITNNDLAGVSGLYIWDGLSDNGTMLKPNPYIVLIESFNTNGYKKSVKKVVILAND